MRCQATNFTLPLGLDTAVAIPRNLHVMFEKSFRTSTFVVLFGTVWGCVHLPCHGDVTQDDLWSMSKETEGVVINLRRRNRTSRIVIGSDLTVCLAPSREGFTSSRIHPNVNSASSCWREAVTEWMHSLRLRHLCTFELSDCLTVACVGWDHDSSWTHENSNKGGLFQLDYMLVSGQVQREARVVRGGYHLNSDHWPIVAFLRLEHKELWCTVNQDEFLQRGRAPKNDEAKQIFMRGVAKDLCWLNGEAKGRAPYVRGGDHLLTCSWDDSDNSASRQWSGLQNHRKRLAELRATLRQEVAREIRINLRRYIRRELTAKLRMVKGEQLDRLLAGYFERGKQTLEIQLPDGLSAERHAYDDNDVDAQLPHLTRLQLLAQREMAQELQPLVVKFDDFLNALAGAKACKQPGSDGVVVEMVRALSCSQLANSSVAVLTVPCSLGRLGDRKTRGLARGCADSHC